MTSSLNHWSKNKHT